MPDADCTGLWVSADSETRKLFLPNGRYMVMFGRSGVHYQGEYRVIGDRIDYRTDDGRTGESWIVDGVLRHGDSALYPEDYEEVLVA